MQIILRTIKFFIFLILSIYTIQIVAFEREICQVTYKDFADYFSIDSESCNMTNAKMTDISAFRVNNTAESTHNTSGVNSFPSLDEIEYNAQDEKLSVVLKNIASLFNLTTVVSNNIKGTYTGSLTFTTADQAFRKLASEFNFVWYKTNYGYYFYSDEEMVNTTIKAKSLTPDALINTLTALGAYDAKFPINGATFDGINLINISAPPAYLDKINEVITSFSEEKGSTANESVIKVYRLKYTSAYDRSYQVSGETRVIPGIATVLNNIFRQGFNANTAIVKEGEDIDTLVSQQTAVPINANAAANNTPIVPAAVPTAYADVKSNSVVVNTFKSSISMVNQLIETLDVPEEQIKIQLVIADVNTNVIDELGVNWSGSYSNDTFSIGFNQAAGGGSAETLVSTSQINASINALTSTGQADVTARPTVLVKNNVEAVLENTETFYVKLRGIDTSDLVPVDYGTKVVVQPRIMKDEKFGEVIYMTVNVSDGSSSNETVETLGLPTIQNMYISTQASVREGESLLIGGYTKERTEQSASGLPVIGKIPVLGRLFSTTIDTQSNQVRLFLISPKIERNRMLATNSDTAPLPDAVDEKIERLKNLDNTNESIGELNKVQIMVGCGTPGELRAMRQDIIAKGGKAYIRELGDKSCLYMSK